MPGCGISNGIFCSSIPSYKIGSFSLELYTSRDFSLRKLDLQMLLNKEYILFFVSERETQTVGNDIWLFP